MTKRNLFSLLVFCVLGGVFLVSCEEPQKSGSGAAPAEEPAPPEETGEQDAKPDEAEAAGAEKEPDATATAEEPKLKEAPERTQPELRVFWEDGAIIAEGAFTSRIQQERIGSELGAAFSGTRVENRVELDYDRYPVGWGNRVAQGFLVPYFKEIEDAAVSYHEGVITLEGKGNKRLKRHFQELAVNIFSGTFSEDIENRIAVE